MFFGIFLEPFWFRVLVVEVARIVLVFLFLFVFWIYNRLFIREISDLFLLGFVGFAGKRRILASVYIIIIG